MKYFIENAFDANGIKYKAFNEPLNKSEILAEFKAQEILGKENGYTPLIISISDTLADSVGFSFEDNGFDVEFSPPDYFKNVSLITEKAKQIDGKKFIQSNLPSEEIDPEIVETGIEFIAEMLITKQVEIFSADYPPAGIIIANIPTINPWELPAWITMGGFNDCPNPENQVAVFKYWYDTYGAVPISVSYDIWEAVVKTPPTSTEDAITLAREQYSFCSDIVEQGVGTIEALAANLHENKYWYFWWD